MRLVLAAPAKVNLHLEILGRRADGFHALETVFQTIGLADRVEVEAGAGDGVSCSCSEPTLPSGPGNLAHRAAAAWLAAAGCHAGIAIRIDKRLPHGAGLGGGSSDAAAVLRACDRLLGPLPPGRLAAIALELGSDVPFFLLGGTAHALGRGEILTPLPDLPALPLTVLMPDAQQPTPAVFRELTEAERGPRPARGPAAFAGDPAAWLHNRLAAPARRLCPPAAALLDALAAAGVPHLLSGSGAACFCLGAAPDLPGVRAFPTRLRPRADLDRVIDTP